METNVLKIEIVNTVDEAPNYKSNNEKFKAAVLKKAIIVRKGTIEGNDTIDLQFQDAAGNKYVAMVTAQILKTLTDLTNQEGN